MELIMVTAFFSAINFAAMTGFTSAYDSIVEPEAEGQVEIYQVENTQTEKSPLQRATVVNAKSSEE